MGRGCVRGEAGGRTGLEARAGAGTLPGEGSETRGPGPARGLLPTGARCQLSAAGKSPCAIIHSGSSPKTQTAATTQVCVSGCREKTRVRTAGYSTATRRNEVPRCATKLENAFSVRSQAQEHKHRGIDSTRIRHSERARQASVGVAAEGGVGRGEGPPDGEGSALGTRGSAHGRR